MLTLLRLAIPVALAQLMTAAAGLVDTLMAGRAGVTDLAGVSLGSAIWLTLGVGVMGLFMAVNPIVAQYVGAGEQRRIAGFMHQALRVSVVLTLFLFLLLRLHVWYLPAIIDDAGVVRVTGGYLDGFSWGLPAFLGTLMLRRRSSLLIVVVLPERTTSASPRTSRMMSSLIYEDYKLNYDFITQRHEVFHLASDPCEKKNLLFFRPDIGPKFAEKMKKYREVRAAHRKIKLDVNRDAVLIDEELRYAPPKEIPPPEIN